MRTERLSAYVAPAKQVRVQEREEERRGGGGERNDTGDTIREGGRSIKSEGCLGKNFMDDEVGGAGGLRHSFARNR